MYVTSVVLEIKPWYGVAWAPPYWPSEEPRGICASAKTPSPGVQSDDRLSSVVPRTCMRCSGEMVDDDGCSKAVGCCRVDVSDEIIVGSNDTGERLNREVGVWWVGNNRLRSHSEVDEEESNDSVGWLKRVEVEKVGTSNSENGNELDCEFIVDLSDAEGRLSDVEEGLNEVVDSERRL